MAKTFSAGSQWSPRSIEQRFSNALSAKRGSDAQKKTQAIRQLENAVNQNLTGPQYDFVYSNLVTFYQGLSFIQGRLDSGQINTSNLLLFAKVFNRFFAMADRETKKGAIKQGTLRQLTRNLPYTYCYAGVFALAHGKESEALEYFVEAGDFVFWGTNASIIANHLVEDHVQVAIKTLGTTQAGVSRINFIRQSTPAETMITVPQLPKLADLTIATPTGTPQQTPKPTQPVQRPAPKKAATIPQPTPPPPAPTPPKDIDKEFRTLVSQAGNKVSQKQYIAAIRDYLAALALKEDAQAQRELGHTLRFAYTWIEAGENQQKVDRALSLLNIKDDEVKAYLIVANFYIARTNGTKAAPFIEKAKGLDTADEHKTQLEYLEGSCLYYTEKYEAALKILENFTSDHAYWKNVLGMLLDLYQKLNLPIAGLALLEKARPHLNSNRYYRFEEIFNRAKEKGKPLDAALLAQLKEREEALQAREATVGEREGEIDRLKKEALAVLETREDELRELEASLTTMFLRLEEAKAVTVKPEPAAPAAPTTPAARIDPSLLSAAEKEARSLRIKVGQLEEELRTGRRQLRETAREIERLTGEFEIVDGARSRLLMANKQLEATLSSDPAKAKATIEKLKTQLSFREEKIRGLTKEIQALEQALIEIQAPLNFEQAWKELGLFAGLFNVQVASGAKALSAKEIMERRKKVLATIIKRLRQGKSITTAALQAEASQIHGMVINKRIFPGGLTSIKILAAAIMEKMGLTLPSAKKAIAAAKAGVAEIEEGREKVIVFLIENPGITAPILESQHPDIYEIIYDKEGRFFPGKLREANRLAKKRKEAAEAAAKVIEEAKKTAEEARAVEIQTGREKVILFLIDHPNIEASTIKEEHPDIYDIIYDKEGRFFPGKFREAIKLAKVAIATKEEAAMAEAEAYTAMIETGRKKVIQFLIDHPEIKTTEIMQKHHDIHRILYDKEKRFFPGGFKEAVALAVKTAKKAAEAAAAQKSQRKRVGTKPPKPPLDPAVIASKRARAIAFLKLHPEIKSVGQIYEADRAIYWIIYDKRIFPGKSTEAFAAAKAKE